MGYRFQIGQKVICTNALMANRNESEDLNWRPPVTLQQGAIYEIIDHDWEMDDYWIALSVDPNTYYLGSFFSPLPLDYEWVEELIKKIKNTAKE